MPTTMPIKDAAQMLGVSIDTIRRRLKRGELISEFVDGRWLVTLPDEQAGRAPTQLTEYAFRMLTEEIERLRTENDRLLGIIEALSRGEVVPAP